jgi:peptidoglycan/xylan/chitin deacetylase (PgdA/CDA1 family)
MNSSISNKKNITLIPVLLFIIFMVIVSGYILYQLFPKKNNINIFFPIETKKKVIYILISDDTKKYLFATAGDFTIYLENINKFINKLKKNNFKILKISEKDLLTIPKNSIVIALDNYKVTDHFFNTIKTFIKSGGTFIFNYHFGYFEDRNQFIGPKRIENITGLKFISESIPKESTNFYIPHLLSPFIKNDLDAKREDLVLYGNDIIPLFKSNFTPDLVLTNWGITSTPILNNKMLTVNESGIAWHGFLDKGKWIYFSIPSYVFLDMKNDTFKKLITNIYDFATKPLIIATYPYLNTKKAIFISEDTEYKYENMIHFARLAKKYNIHTTLFCVASLAEKYPQITKEAASFPNIEIGSHSFSHTKIIGASEEKVIKEILGSKKILEKITSKKIYGFRPPREEIDKLMEYWLRKAGYKYLMEKVKPFLLPKEVYKGLITIPRHGTDDYIYLINLNWDKKKILNKIIQETEMLTSLNALYTLSVHTHLLSYKSNLSVTKEYFEYLKRHPDITPLKGIELAKRAKMLPNIFYKQEIIGNTIFITIYNKNDYGIKNFKFRIFTPNIEIKKVTPETTKTKLKLIEKNKKRKYNDYEIKNIKPNSATTIIIKYE